MNNLIEEIKGKKILVWDTETEGLNGCFTRPFQIAWFLFENGKQIEAQNIYLKWKNLKVSRGAAQSNNFNPYKVEKEGKDPKEVIDLFCSRLYDENTISVGANILGYDTEIITTARRELGYKTDYSFIYRIHDINAIARGYKWPVKFNEGDDFTLWQFKCLNIKMKGMKTKLEYLCQEFGIEFDPLKLHSADYDSFLTEKVHKALLIRMNN
jgi:DNA polymerase III epsilon subunit-like protein